MRRLKYLLYISVAIFILFITTPELIQKIVFSMNAKQSIGTIQSPDTNIYPSKFFHSSIVPITFATNNGEIINVSATKDDYIFPESLPSTVPVLYDPNNP